MRPMRRRPRLASCLAPLILSGAAIACGGPEGPPVRYENAEAGYGYEVPRRWILLADEARSPKGSLFTVKVHSLEGARQSFVAGLPETVIPQIEEWTQYFFGTPGVPERGTATVGGEPAHRLTYRVTIRAGWKPTRVDYWIVRHGQLLYLARAVYAAGLEGTEAPAVTGLLESWRFHDSPPAAASSTNQVARPTREAGLSPGP